MKDIKRVKLIFGDGDSVEIDTDCFYSLDITNIEEEVHKVKYVKTAKHISFMLLQKANKPFYSYDDENCEEPLFDKIKGSDIIDIELLFHDNSSISFYVDWKENEECFNRNQRVEITSLGDLLCVIDDNKSIRDCFDLDTLNDKEAMNSHELISH